MGARGTTFVDVTPSASRLTSSLRDIGYDFVSALADIVDNSVSAQASRIDIVLEFDGPDSRVIIADDGDGMTQDRLNEALRFGSRRSYDAGDLGRFGLGLKTASLSQCRRLTVVTRRTPVQRRIVAMELDLETISRIDRWLVRNADGTDAWDVALDWLIDGPGTVVVWDDLDRVLQPERASSGWQKRRFTSLAAKSSAYLGMVFHRFLEGTATGGRPVTMTVNGAKVRPWSPFAPDEPSRIELAGSAFELTIGDDVEVVRIRPYVLPAKNLFSSPEQFDHLSGPRKWNRQQGLYVYRADRMIQSGGWSGLRAADEHTKLARMSLDFPTTLDELFRINVAKMRVSLPPQLRQQLERPIQELCGRAQAMYRRDGVKGNRRDSRSSGDAAQADTGTALRAAALEIGELDVLERIVDQLHVRAPEITSALGLRD